MHHEEDNPPAAESTTPASTITRWPMPSGVDIVIETKADGSVFVNGDLVTPFDESE